MSKIDASEKKTNRVLKRKRKLIKAQNISITDDLGSDRNIFQSKQEASVRGKRSTDKNNDWKVLGKPYKQFVFVSVRSLCIILSFVLFFC